MCMVSFKIPTLSHNGVDSWHGSFNWILARISNLAALQLIIFPYVAIKVIRATGSKQQIQLIQHVL